MGVDQHVDVGKQHLESVLPKFEPGFVVYRVQSSGAVKIDAGAWMDTTRGNQAKGRRFRRLSTLECIVQRSGNERTHADALGRCLTTHLLP